MVLAGWRRSLLFFGVSPSAFGGNGARSSTPSSSPSPTSFSAAMARVEEANLTNAVDASEAETAGDGEFAGQGNGDSVQEEYSGGMYCWVNMIRRFSEPSVPQLM